MLELHDQDLELPPADYSTRDKEVRFRVTPQEHDHYRQLAFRVGYTTFAELCRAGLTMVEKAVEARELQARHIQRQQPNKRKH